MPFALLAGAVFRRLLGWQRRHPENQDSKQIMNERRRCPAGQRFFAFDADYSERASISSNSWPKSSRACSTGLGEAMSTPAIFSREMGSMLLPEDRNFL